MDKSSYDNMKRYVDTYFTDTSMLIADIGSYDVNGSYRDIIAPHRFYTGIDIIAGPNVDLVMNESYNIPIADNYFDAAISGQCFEHVCNPFKLMKEISRIVRSGGVIITVVPLDQPEHRYPVDCWRILSDGWQSLFDESDIELIKTEYVVKYNKKGVKRQDSWAAGRVK